VVGHTKNFHQPLFLESGFPLYPDSGVESTPSTTARCCSY
jgi:hypothetical protein